MPLLLSSHLTSFLLLARSQKLLLPLHSFVALAETGLFVE
jgi:hypothetical protein